jgi:hypothetical protein
VAEIEQRVENGAELQMGVALRPKIIILLEQIETKLGRKFTFAGIVRAFDPLEIDCGHSVHIENGFVSRLSGLCRKCSRYAFGRVHPESF